MKRLLLLSLFSIGISTLTYATRILAPDVQVQNLKREYYENKLKSLDQKVASLQAQIDQNNQEQISKTDPDYEMFEPVRQARAEVLRELKKWFEEKIAKTKAKLQ